MLDSLDPFQSISLLPEIDSGDYRSITDIINVLNSLKESFINPKAEYEGDEEKEKEEEEYTVRMKTILTLAEMLLMSSSMIKNKF